MVLLYFIVIFYNTGSQMVERFKTHLFKSKFASNKNFTRPDLSDQIFFGKLWIVPFI